MKKFRINKTYITFLLLFLTILTICLLYKNGYLRLPFFVDINVVVVANILLLLLSVFGIRQHIKALKSNNPNVFIRSIMLMTILKFFVLGGAAIAYIVLSKQNRNIPGILIGMVLYIVYAVFEVNAAYNLNKKKRN